MTYYTQESPNPDQQFLDSYPNRELLTIALEVFHIPPARRPDFERYYLLHWSPEYLLSTYLYGTIYRENIRYLVVGIDTPGILALSQKPQIRLSFRKLPDMPFGFVLIRKLGV